MSIKNIRKTMYQSLLDLRGDGGIYASGKNEIYGCIFGRDSAITILKLLDIFKITGDHQLLETAKETLLTLTNLQGQETNLENGEQPGKFIHEFRKDKYEHLISSATPWFLQPDQTIRNYDSVDSTPLGLIAIYRYFEITQDQEFIQRVLPAVDAGIKWLIEYGDLDGDKLLEYEFNPQRKFGGLKVQSWTDSTESLLRHDGSFPNYPIAPVEAQGYSWLAIKLWADFYRTRDKTLSETLVAYAVEQKESFNQKFIFRDGRYHYVAQALDGSKNQIPTITANPLLCLWAGYKNGGSVESIIDNKYVEGVVRRAFRPDLYVKGAGIRTMSATSATFNPRQDSYHNGSFWPFLNGLAVEGLLNFGFNREAKRLRQATLKAIRYFKCPIELYTKGEEGYLEYVNSGGQVGCRQQAWSAATLLYLVVS